MINSTTSIGNAGYFSLQLENKKSKDLLKRISAAVCFPFAIIKQEWVGIKEISKVMRNVLRIVATSHPNTKMARMISRLSLLMGIDALFTLISYPKTIASFHKNAKLKDMEGTILGAFSLISTPSDALSSFLTFASSLVELKIVPMLPLFSLITLPLNLGLIAYSSLKNVYDLTWYSLSLVNSPKQVTAPQMADLKEKLRMKLDIIPAEKAKIEQKHYGNQPLINRKIELLKARKINILTRHTDQKVVAIQKRLFERLERNDINVDDVNKALKDSKTLMKRKVIAHTLSTSCSLAVGTTTFVASLFFPVTAYLTAALGLTKSLISIGKHYYERFAVKKGLELPNFPMA